MTEKLYYKDAYIKEFTSEVISCERTDGGYLVVLSETAFFPEEGGQYSDRGTLSGASVLSVSEKDGVIYHLTDEPLPVGSTAEGKIDFDERFEKMQCHTAEHILSGLIHSTFGYSNVGFHLGADEVTMDISAPLCEAELSEIERRANEVVFENVEVEELYPSPEELSGFEYRSKLDITENVRIVKIGEYDSCACCAPHVKRTGEIGSIKIIDFTGLRGGIRIRITAGRRAYKLYSAMNSNLAVISHLLSVPKTECAAAVERYVADAEKTKAALKASRLAFFEAEAARADLDAENPVFVYEGASIEEMRVFANKAVKRTRGMLVLLSPTEDDCKYIIASERVDLKGEIKKINTALEGRGGGNSVMVQGSFKAPLSVIREYFK